MALSDAGLQFLVAAARPNVGMKSGRHLGPRGNAKCLTRRRYMFEVRVLEVLLPAMPGVGNQIMCVFVREQRGTALAGGRTAPLQPIPRQQCRIGFSKQGSSLFLGETASRMQDPFL